MRRAIGAMLAIVIARRAAFLALLAAACSSSPSALDGSATDLRAAAREAGDGARPDARRDSFVPFALELTVNRIPVAMNGSVPFRDLAGKLQPFRLTLPRHGFSLDVGWRGSSARADTLAVTADAALGSGPAAVAAGTDLAPRFARAAGSARWLVPPELASAASSLTFRATISDGATTREAKLEVDLADKTFLLDPFRLEDTWLLVFSQDSYTIARTSDAGGKLAISSSPKPNGLHDFEEDLRAIGLGTPAMLPAAAATKRGGVTGTNAIVRGWFEREILRGVRRAYLRADDGGQTSDSVRIRFHAEGDPGAPKLADYKLQVLKGGETERQFSTISIGGGDITRGLLGLSKTIDLRNVRSEDNLGPGYGVFTTRAIATLAEMLEKDALVKSVFRVLFGDFVPELGLGGKPVGESPLDAAILADGFDPKQASSAAASRHQKLSFIVETLGRLCGALTAHEIGHSLGLVADGPPPTGLFGGESNAAFVNAARTTSGHIDTAGFNLMEAGPGSAPGAPLDPLQFLTEPRFNELNLAYLQGRVLLLPK